MPSIYLEPDDYAMYGVPLATASQVIKASTIIDGYLNKPEGLIYTVDGDDEPSAMALSGFPIRFYTTSPQKNQVVLSYTPVRKLISVEYDSAPGSTPVYTTVSGSVFDTDGRLWLADQVFSYANLKIEYVAGWVYATLPSAIKQACADIVAVMQEGIVIGGVSKYQAGDTSIQYAINKTSGSIYIDEATALMLAPYQRIFA